MQSMPREIALAEPTVTDHTPPQRDREATVYNARLAEQAERYDEMAEFMKSVAQMKKELAVEERNLLSVAYKNSVGARRASWRVLSSVEAKQRAKGNESNALLAGAYRMTVEEELRRICNDILRLLDKNLIDSASNPESRVFYYKMKGDYYRYISEFSCEKTKKEPTEQAKLAYEEATRYAVSELLPTHPIRLGLALNFSVFYYEIVGQPCDACEMARQAFDEAIAELDNVSEESYRDSTLIMQLLRDNLTLWTSDTAVEKEAALAAGAQPGSTAAPTGAPSALPTATSAAAPSAAPQTGAAPPAPPTPGGSVEDAPKDDM